MKPLLPLLFALFLLTACTPAPEAPALETVPPVTQPVSLYIPDSPMEKTTQGAVMTYDLPLSDISGLCNWGDDLLFFSGNTDTALTRLDTAQYTPSAATTLNVCLSPRDASFTVSGDCLSFFDPSSRETVLLDEALQEVKRIAAPEDMTGIPILSPDGTTLYYCTPTALRAWDLATGIRRLIKEMAYPVQSLAGLHAGGTIAQCCVTDESGQVHSLFVSTGNGRLLAKISENVTLFAENGRYFCVFPQGILTANLSGAFTSPPAALTPTDLDAACFYLPNSHSAVSVSDTSDGTIRLDHYELTTGLRTASLSYPSDETPIQITDDSSGNILILNSDCLYLWDTEKMRINDGNRYTGPYFTAAAPDLPGLTFCQSYADQISQRYGIEIKIWQDALEVLPWDYTVEEEYLVPLLERELQRLDAALAVFPEEFLATTVSNFSKLRISLVRSLSGTEGISSAHGVQFFDGTDAHILLTPGEKLEQSLYHELYHVMETQILNESIALDQWDKLNPPGFHYDLDYAANATREAGIYLTDENRCFIDTYSMSYPKEDRARILEYAMTSGHSEYFRSPQMQAKLSQLCQGIREAYGLTKREEPFLWEQYLLS